MHNEIFIWLLSKHEIIEHNQKKSLLLKLKNNEYGKTFEKMN